MKSISLLILAIFIIASCSTENSNSERPAEWVGVWKAKWETDPASFGNTEGITDFTMPGQITITSDSINIQAFGFEGCVFSRDTLNHTLRWKINGDSLVLINDEETPGMVYMIKEKTAKTVRLQLMEDIFLNLSK